MSHTVSRLILSMVVLLFTAGVYTPLFIISNGYIRTDELAFLSADLICGFFLTVTWIFVWRNDVRWTTKRRLLTVIALFVALIPAIAVYDVMAPSSQWFGKIMGLIFGAMAWALTWIAATAFIWCETKRERTDRLRLLGIHIIACPACGYNLTGLHEARCPECGSQFTLDELFTRVTEEKRELET